MLKRFSPNPEPLDDLKYTKPLTIEQLENDLVFRLDRSQLKVSSDAELKELFRDELTSLARTKNMSVDEFYDYLAESYPYNDEKSCWGSFPNELLERWANKDAKIIQSKNR